MLMECHIFIEYYVEIGSVYTVREINILTPKMMMPYYSKC